MGRAVDRAIRLSLAPLSAANSLARVTGHGSILRVPCLFTGVFHHACPGCGLTRALDLLWRGHWHEAVAMNPLCPLAFLLLWGVFWLQAAEIYGQIVSPRKSLYHRLPRAGEDVHGGGLWQSSGSLSNNR
jgi:hypothetical protein